MLYRKLPHGAEQFSVIGMGMGSIHDESEEEILQTQPWTVVSTISIWRLQMKSPIFAGF